MEDRLQVYLKEYDMLTAETRHWLAANDPKLTVAFTACIGLAGAGAWKGAYSLLLIIPFIVLFIGFILLFQFSNIVHIAAQLAILEEKINALIGNEPSLTYYSQTVINIFDQPVCYDPKTGVRHIPLGRIYCCSIIVVLILIGGVILAFALPNLANQNLSAAIAYGAVLAISVAVFCFLFFKVSRSKQFYMNLIRENYTNQVGG